MTKRFRAWLYRFLAAWAKETLIEDLNAKDAELAKLRADLAERDAYIKGLQSGVKAQRRIIINTGVSKK